MLKISKFKLPLSKAFKNKNIIFFDTCTDTKPLSKTLIFPNIEMAICISCDKNFMKNINPNTFPNLKTIYINNYNLLDESIYKFKQLTIYFSDDCNYDDYYNHTKIPYTTHNNPNIIIEPLNYNHFKTFINMSNTM
jgi:hypothetical protein